MNSFRNFIRFVLALTLVIFSLSGFAVPPTGQKNFAVNISPLVVPPGGPWPLQAAFTNTSPPASNSTINSTILTLPAGSPLTIGTVSAPSTGRLSTE